MARAMKVVLTDDFDGSPAAETVSFGLDQFTYEIELSDKNATALREALAPYIAKGRKTAAQPRRRQGTGKRQAPSYMDGLSASDVRTWAQENGHEISDRGRIPQPVAEAYRAAH